MLSFINKRTQAGGGVRSNILSSFSGLTKPYMDIKYVLPSSLQHLNGFTINLTG